MNLYREYKEKQMQEQYQKYDKEYFAKDTVTIYEQTRTQDFIIRIFKICVFAILLLGLMGSLVWLFSTILPQGEKHVWKKKRKP